MKEIPLTRGKFALVDDEDYEWLSQWKWYCSTTGYAVRGCKNRILYMHREIAKTKPGMLTDHINRNKLDNRKENLRFCSHRENMKNR